MSKAPPTLRPTGSSRNLLNEAPKSVPSKAIDSKGSFSRKTDMSLGDTKKIEPRKLEEKPLVKKTLEDKANVKKVEDKSPDRIIRLLDCEEISADVAKKVKEAVKTSSKSWLFQFLDLGGLQSISFHLIKVQGLSEKTTDEIRTQFDLLLSVKAIMNNQTGLDIMIEQPDLVASVALNIDSEDTAICIQTLELLAVIMVTGEAGSRAVLESLDFFKLVTRERVRFQCLVDALHSSETTYGFKRDIILFLNTVINTSLELEDRLEVRADMIYSGILPTIEKLKQVCFDELGKDIENEYDSETNELQELESQLQVFETVMQRDISECVTDMETTFQSSEVDLSDPEQIFQSLHASSVEHECFMPFLCVLQSLLLIPSYDTFGKQQWETVENSIQQIVAGTLKTDEDVSGIIANVKNRLVWKQRMEELAQTEENLSIRCQEYEMTEAALRSELEELRNKESVMLFMREKERKASEIITRQLRHLQELREAEKDIVSRAEDILNGNIELTMTPASQASSATGTPSSMTKQTKQNKMLRARSLQASSGGIAIGPVSTPVIRSQGSRHIMQLTDLDDGEGEDSTASTPEISGRSSLSRPQNKTFSRQPMTRMPKSSPPDLSSNCVDGEDALAELMNERALARSGNSSRNVLAQSSTRSLNDVISGSNLLHSFNENFSRSRSGSHLITTGDHGVTVLPVKENKDDSPVKENKNDSPVKENKDDSPVKENKDDSRRISSSSMLTLVSENSPSNGRGVDNNAASASSVLSDDGQINLLKKKLTDTECRLKDAERELERQRDILREKEEEFKRKLNKELKSNGDNDPRNALLSLLEKSTQRKKNSIISLDDGSANNVLPVVGTADETEKVGKDGTVSQLQSLFGGKAPRGGGLNFGRAASFRNSGVTILEPGQSLFVPAVKTQRKPPIPPPLPQEAFHLLQLSEGIPTAPPLPGEKNEKLDNVRNKPKKENVEPAVPMKSLFWTKIPDRTIHTTIWETLNDEKVILNKDQLHQLFFKAIVKASGSKESGKLVSTSNDGKSKETILLDTKVQQNVGIALAKYRMPSSEIRKAILRMDEARLDIDKLNSLRALAPTTDDITVLREYDGDIEYLGRVEKFFLQIIDIPRYNQRLDCFIFKLKFPILISELYCQLDILSKGVEAVINSTNFITILETILAMGNYLNGNTPRGGAYGFKLDALMKLSTVKSADNKLSLMNMLVQHCEMVDSKLLTIVDDFACLDEAARISLDGCNSDIHSIRKNINQIQAEIEILQKELNVDTSDRFVEVLAPFREEALKDIEKVENEFNNLRMRFVQLIKSFNELETISGEEFFGLLRDFTSQFNKSIQDNEKRRIVSEKADMKKIAEEKKRKLKAEKMAAAVDIDNLVDDVFGSLRDKRADEIVDSLKGSSGIGTRRKNATGKHRSRGRHNLMGTANDNDHEDGAENKVTDGLQSMMSRLASAPRSNGRISSSPPRSSTPPMTKPLSAPVGSLGGQYNAPPRINTSSLDDELNMNSPIKQTVDLSPSLIMSLASEISNSSKPRVATTHHTPPVTLSAQRSLASLSAKGSTGNGMPSAVDMLPLKKNVTRSPSIDPTDTDQSELAAFLRKKKSNVTTSPKIQTVSPSAFGRK